MAFEFLVVRQLENRRTRRMQQPYLGRRGPAINMGDRHARQVRGTEIAQKCRYESRMVFPRFPAAFVDAFIQFYTASQLARQIDLLEAQPAAALELTAFALHEGFEL